MFEIFWGFSHTFSYCLWNLIDVFPAFPVIMVQEMSSRPGPGGELIVLLIQMRLKFQDVLVRTRTRLQRGVTQTFAVFSVVLLLLWISVFLYGSLYYSYMPNVAFSTAVHYYQRYVCELACTGKTHTTDAAVFPSAGQAVNHMHPSCALIHWQMCLWQGTGSMYVWCTLIFIFSCNLWKTPVIKMCLQVLTFGQAYRISLLMEMPDSQVNQAVGMFMIKTTFYSQDGGQVISSAQPVRNTDVC